MVFLCRFDAIVMGIKANKGFGMIIVIAGEKGGTGKTTLATNLAQIRREQGHDVLLLDSDVQASSSVWTAIRDENEEAESVPCMAKLGASLHKQIKDLEKRYDDIVVDTGGRDSVEMRSAIAVADKVYIPIRASQFDVSTLIKMQKLVEEAKIYNQSLEVYVCINQASTNIRVSEHQSAKKLIQSDQLPDLLLSGAVIHDRIAFRNGAEKGKGVAELGKSKAKDEMIKLYKEVFNAA